MKCLCNFLYFGFGVLKERRKKEGEAAVEEEGEVQCTFLRSKKERGEEWVCTGGWEKLGVEVSAR